ncbi:hypothetical protein CERZMDRAFT_94037 [Cercospora zeae-maydis SCOH1-5]|uniref:Uncharacterized protein n=1 Tax=Cercospora zeae-maydis SCOH1-5 TaxID=717836 RepID=A0A6A6FQ81_9PEZI|nr:hypothetical protein CERZMDRAFT_94037 [Cercospora zeae-maydis SCOH1-5]
MLFDENFTFDTPRSPSLSSDLTLSTRDTSRSVSPCTADTTAAYPPPRFSVTDLATSFASSRLRHDSQICYDSCEAYANMDDDDAAWAIPGVDEECSYSRSRTRTLPQRPHSPTRRMARQMNTRLLCSTAHAKDIATLVARMVDSKEHCNVVGSSPTTSCGSIHRSVDSINDDEGYDSGSGRSAATSRCSSLAVQRSRMDYRRTSDLKPAGGVRVSKAVRQKKEVKHRRVRSQEE